MFLDVLRRRNGAFVDAAIALHQDGAIPAGSYVIDLDAVTRNARLMRDEADRLGLEVLAMTKQVGRGAPFARAVLAGGIDRAVAVDMQCARACHDAGLGVGHLGHLVQVARAQADEAAAMQPDNWTVFSHEKAAEAAAAAGRAGREQDLLARVVASGDTFYRGHEGGFDAADAVAVADAFDALPNARFAGITTFPAMLFDQERRSVRPTPNLRTLEAVAAALAGAGRTDIRINAPGTTSSATFRAVADAGATQVEPGHGLTGTTPLHAVEDLPEEPAALYVSEVSHHHGGRAYCFGGGFYIDPVFPPYDLRAVVAAGDDRLEVSAEIPPPEAIDYYGMLTPPEGRRLPVGASVVFGFRIQAFVARAWTVGIAGAGTGAPRVEGLWGPDGRETSCR